MILRRLGNKKKVAKLIMPHFPPHKVYIEPFFGAGGMFFQKPKAKYNIVNDLDSDVFNLFQVVMNQKEEFLQLLEITPYSSELFNYWKDNKETNSIKKALRFIFLSNFGFLGQQTSIRIDSRNHKKNTLTMFNMTIDFLKDCSLKFTNNDFRKAISCISLSEKNTIDKTFIYNDPPYQNTTDNYSNSFVKQDLIDLIETNIKTGCKFAISEFDTDVVLELAEKYNLEVIVIGERQNLTNRRTEILIVNYESPALYGLFSANNFAV